MMPAFSNYDMWKLQSPDDDRPEDEFEPVLEEMTEADWCEKQEIEMKMSDLIGIHLTADGAFWNLPPSKWGTVRAIQFTGNNCIEILAFMDEHEAVACPEIHTTDTPVVHTRDGQVCPSVGDWIVKDGTGDFYVRKDVHP